MKTNNKNVVECIASDTSAVSLIYPISQSSIGISTHRFFIDKTNRTNIDMHINESIIVIMLLVFIL